MVVITGVVVVRGPDPTENTTLACLLWMKGAFSNHSGI